MSYPKSQTDLRHVLGHRCTELRKLVQQGRAYLQLGDLAIKVSRHYSLTQQLEATHLVFHQPSPVISATVTVSIGTKVAA